MTLAKAGGIKINYEREGSGPFIVLAHGHGANLHFFDDLTSLLKKDYTVVRYDQRGYGLSNKPVDQDDPKGPPQSSGSRDEGTPAE